MKRYTLDCTDNANGVRDTRTIDAYSEYEARSFAIRRGLVVHEVIGGVELEQAVQPLSTSVAIGILKAFGVLCLLSMSCGALAWGYREMQKPPTFYVPHSTPSPRVQAQPSPPVIDRSIPDGTDDEEKHYLPPRRLTKAEGEALHKWFEQRRKERAAQRAGK